MDRLRYEFLLRAETPIAHHEETFGNVAVAMRRKIRQRDGSMVRVPIVTADTMRHGMREAVAYAFLDAAGLLDDTKLSEGALRLLFAGGMITGRGDASAIKLDGYREMIDLVPSLALFGGCAGNRAIPGRLQVDDATLVCQEAAEYIPPWIGEVVGPLTTGRSHLEEETRVRMDPMLDPGKRLLLRDGLAVEQRLLASERASEVDNAHDREEAKSSMMPRSFERIAQGSLFSWGLSALCWTPLDRDTLHVSLAAFLSSASVGGKKATGHGRLRCIQANVVSVLRPAETMQLVDVGALPSGTLFRAHVFERKERIARFLETVNA